MELSWLIELFEHIFPAHARRELSYGHNWHSDNDYCYKRKRHPPIGMLFLVFSLILAATVSPPRFKSRRVAVPLGEPARHMSDRHHIDHRLRLALSDQVVQNGASAANGSLLVISAVGSVKKIENREPGIILFISPTECRCAFTAGLRRHSSDIGR